MPISDDAADRIEDAAAAVFEGAVSMIPIFGGPAAVAVNRALGSAVERRRGEIIKALREDLDRVLANIDDPIALVSSDSFVAAATRTVRGMEETARLDRQRLLRNAFVNGLDPARSVSERESELFGRVILRYDPEHIKVLSVVAGLTVTANAWPKETTEERILYSITGELYPRDWSDQQRELANDVVVIIGELTSDGLVEAREESKVMEKLNNSVSGGGTSGPDSVTHLRATDRGRRFLALVADPNDDSDHP